MNRLRFQKPLQVRKVALDRMEQVAAYLCARTKGNVSGSGGESASQEGEFPRRQSGALAESIRVWSDRSGGVISVGTDSVYARRLEFGFHETDALGRSVAQGSRSFLRRTFLEELSAMRRQLGRRALIGNRH